MDKLQRSVKGISLLIVALFLFLYTRVAWLQAFQQEEVGLKAGSIRRIWVQAPRGNIIDRNGQLVLESRPLYTVKVIPSEISDAGTRYLAFLLELPEEELRAKIEEGRNFSPFAASTVFHDLNEIAVARVSENLWQLPGVTIEVENKRKYNGLFNGTHMLGYLRGVRKEQLDTLAEKGYNPDDKIGATGLEKFYEDHLRGEKGARYELVNPLGMLVGKYADGQSDIPYVKGDDLYLTIDAGLQDLAEKLLRKTGKSGAVVAIDPSTGGILAICSEPDFDLEILNGTTRKQEWADIALSPHKPLFNRAIQAAYPPGSTYKLLLSIAALEEGVVTPETTINCPGYFMFGGRKFKCHGGAHGSVNMTKAIAQSCNVYFYKLILQIGLDKWHDYSEMFGFGDRAGIDLPGEKRGVLPSTRFYDKRFGKGRWSKGYLVSLGIGQGELNTTPLQLANFAATIANNGIWHQPHLVSGFRDTRSNTYVPLSYDSDELPISRRSFDVVKEGMKGVVLHGTGTLAQVPGVTVAGKTGTAQNPHGQDHAWFVCFAPIDQPKIAITVLVENAGFGGSVSAPIARELINYYVNVKGKGGKSYSATNAVNSISAFSDSLKSGGANPAGQSPTDSSGQARPGGVRAPEEDPGD
ncbi:MAG: penicillin-binding protein 2 [Chlorobiaceae bacterium]|nr:penicillin-binding protein 2 [Chlorobiaceae bacterium]NTW74480.1 penicillin-binding protein 2 [Chlorobiaceae bacterium]